MEKNRVKIICNPYKKSIEYERWDLDEGEDIYIWKKLGNKSQLLLDEKYTNATIQHNAYEIVEEINREYNRGKVGLEIIFNGTKEDYEDLKEVVDEFFDQSGVSCELGDLYIASASEVMPEIRNVFRDLAQVFREYDTKEINQIIAKFLDATKTEIPICVVGMYSTGKSAFINALIGAEVLPSAVNPTTARNYKIVESEKNGSIKFYIGTEKITIFYEEDKYKIEGNIDKELRDKIYDALEKVDNPILTTNMYYSLCTINEYADKTEKIEKSIEVEVPFHNSILVSDDYKFIIYDTPGSDSESHEEHLNVLKKTLGDQTNGLPILLTSPKDMDRTGADVLLKVVKEIDGNLDLTNALILVNQADGVSGKSLDKLKECDDTILSQWKSNRLYFISAIMGLGSKIDNYEDDDAWIDLDYVEIFLKNMDSFTNPNGRVYKQLYKHNQITKNRMNNYCSLVADAEGDRNLLYINSGLHCVENEIIEFAKKYALYNKCAQAQDYLKKAIIITKEYISETERKVEEFKQKLASDQSKEKQILLDRLSYCIKINTGQYTVKYRKNMSEVVVKLIAEASGEIPDFVSDEWTKIKKNAKKERVDKFLVLLQRALIENENKCKTNILQNSKEYWTEAKSDLQRKCCKIIKEDEHLSFEEQKFLGDFIMQLDIRLDVDAKIDISPDDICIHLINLFGRKFLRIDRIKQKETMMKYYELLGKYIRRINAWIIAEHTKEFNNWNRKLESGLIKEAARLNPSLRKLSADLDECQKKIDLYQSKLIMIERELGKIAQMFEFKERNNNDCCR